MLILALAEGAYIANQTGLLHRAPEADIEKMAAEMLARPAIKVVGNMPADPLNASESTTRTLGFDGTAGKVAKRDQWLVLDQWILSGEPAKERERIKAQFDETYRQIAAYEREKGDLSLELRSERLSAIEDLFLRANVAMLKFTESLNNGPARDEVKFSGDSPPIPVAANFRWFYAFNDWKEGERTGIAILNKDWIGAAYHAHSLEESRFVLWEYDDDGNSIEERTFHQYASGDGAALYQFEIAALRRQGGWPGLGGLIDIAIDRQVKLGVETFRRRKAG